MFSEAVGLLEQVGFKPSPKLLSSTYQWWWPVGNSRRPEQSPCG